MLALQLNISLNEHESLSDTSFWAQVHFTWITSPDRSTIHYENLCDLRAGGGAYFIQLEYLVWARKWQQCCHRQRQ